MKSIASIILILIISSRNLICENIVLQSYSTITFSASGDAIAVDVISSASAVINNPIPNNFWSEADFMPRTVYTDRFLSVIGIESTMITDIGTYEINNIDSQGNVSPITYPYACTRLFFDRIDKYALSELNNFFWDGSVFFGTTQVGYNTQSASGYFNQLEQKFYVSDGRQYQVVPEPSAFSLLAIGLGGLAMIRRRRS